MKRCIIALSFVMGSLLVGNAHDITPDSPQKPVKKAVRSSDKETLFVRNLMKKMTLTEKIGQLSQYVGGELLTGPKSGSLTDSLLRKGYGWSI